MKIPYNCVHRCADTLFAARGGKIHTFDLSTHRHLGTWKHPELDTFLAGGGVQVEPEEADDSVMVDEAEPPAKRQKVTEDAQDEKEDEQDKPEAKSEDKSQEKTEEKTAGRRKKGKDQRKPKPLPVPDRPVIIQMATSPDGSHLVAVSGNDKAIWVLANNNGHLTQLSKRIMPKRPSSIVVTPALDILVADKFGDVYAIPLIKSDAPYVPPAKPAAAKQPFSKPAATVLTVHSKGNRAALAAQQRAMTNTSSGGGSSGGSSARAEGPDFAHTLLLGHVSMLTGLLVAQDEQKRNYILTADRDEHIRVSRYAEGQTHVIHGYCLGHKEFVGAMALVEGRTGMLVSGGGDEELFVWNWITGALLSRTNIMTPIKEVAPNVEKVAVSKVLTFHMTTETDRQAHVIIVCEGIPALFTWELLDDHTLTRPSVIQLPGVPLDVAAAVTGTQDLVVALHLSADAQGEGEAARGLQHITLMLDDGRVAVEKMVGLDDGALAEEQDVTEKEVRGLFYTVEHLRKQSGSGPDGDGVDGEGEQQEAAAPEE